MKREFFGGMIATLLLIFVSIPAQGQLRIIIADDGSNGG